MGFFQGLRTISISCCYEHEPRWVAATKHLFDCLSAKTM